MSYLVLARKWRPQRFSELVGQESIARVLTNSIASGKIGQAYIFSGPRGVGKTSSARILAKTLNCHSTVNHEPCGLCPSCRSIAEGSSLDVIEIDGASNNGVDNIRELRENVKYTPSSSRYKIYIIDEAHMLSISAFNAFLKTIEEPPAHVIFVLATTEPRKIPATVLSRCQHLPFKRIPTSKIRLKLKEICSSEGVNPEDSALEIIAKMAEGSMRDALTILDQVISFSGDLRAKDLRDLFGLSDTETLSTLTEAMLTGDYKRIVTFIQGIVDSGTDIRAFAKDLSHFVRGLMLWLAIGEEHLFRDMDEEETAAIKRLSNLTSLPHVALLLNELLKTELTLRQAQYPRVVLEMALIKLSMMSHFKDIEEVIKGLPTKGEGVYKMQGHGTRDLEGIQKPTSMPNAQTTKETLNHVRDASIERSWDMALNLIERDKPLLALVLREGEASFEGTETIVLSFNGGASVHMDSVNEDMPFIKDSLKKASGRDLKIKLTTKEENKPPKNIRAEAMENPLVKEVLRLYEGVIVDVKDTKK